MTAVLIGLYREDDARQMDALVAKLDAMRTQQPPEAKSSKPAKREPAGMTATCVLVPAACVLMLAACVLVPMTELLWSDCALSALKQQHS